MIVAISLPVVAILAGIALDTQDVVPPGALDAELPGIADRASEGDSGVWDDKIRGVDDPQQAREIDDLIAGLDAPEYERREVSTGALIDLGPVAFAQLQAVYRATDSFEARLRIETIVYTAYLNHHVYDRNGFLGVAQSRYTPTADDDPRIPVGRVAIRVQQVIAGSAAERAGVQEDDIIVALDGVPLEGIGQQATAAFGAAVHRRGPGATITLTILRGRSQRQVELKLDRRPVRYYSRQGTVSDMLTAARERFAVWWAQNFQTAGAVKRPASAASLPTGAD